MPRPPTAAIAKILTQALVTVVTGPWVMAAPNFSMSETTASTPPVTEPVLIQPWRKVIPAMMARVPASIGIGQPLRYALVTATAV